MATVAILAGGFLAAASQLQQGRIAEAQGKFEKQIAARNEQALIRQAKAERDAAAIDEARIARREKIVKASQRAALGKTGGGLAGATLSLLADTAAQFSLDRNLTLRRGLIRSRELIARGGIIAAQGAFAKTLGRQAKKASFIKAGGSVLGGFALSGLKFPSGGKVGTGGGLTGLGGSRFPGVSVA